MSKLHRRGYLAISTITAASVLLVVAAAGASAAGEAGSGSASGETVAESPGGSTQAAAPAGSEWTPQGGEGEASSGGSPPLEHGSSVGSGAVTGKTGSASEESTAPPPPPSSSGSYEAEQSIPATVAEPASTPLPGSGSETRSVQPQVTTTPAKASKPAEMAIGDATSLGRPAPPQGDGISSAPPAAPVASLVASGDGSSSNSYALPLLALIALGLILGFAGVRLKRYRRRKGLEALWHEQDAAWEAALRRTELGPLPGSSESSAQPLQRANAA